MDRRAEPSEREWRAWRAAAAMHEHLDRTLSARLRTCEAGVSGSEFDVLAALHDGGGELRARDLAVQLGWEKSRLSHLLSRMQGRGLIARHAGLPDRPGTWISCTPEGREALRTAAPERIEVLRELFFDHVTAEELAVLQSVAERVIGAVGEECAETADECDAPAAATA